MELLIPNMGLLFWTIFSLLIILLPIIALFSLLKSIFKDSTTKLIWVLVILLVPVAGPILYFFIGRRQRVKIALWRWFKRRICGDTNPGKDHNIIRNHLKSLCFKCFIWLIPHIKLVNKSKKKNYRSQ